MKAILKSLAYLLIFLHIRQVKTIRLRQNGIANISDLQWATLEPSGQLGYSLLEEKKPATKEDLDQVQKRLDQLMMQLEQNFNALSQKVNQSESTIFSEIEYGHKKTPTDRHQ